jgi:recombination protein RecR
MNKKSSGAEIERLIALLARLPGLGHRSARKAALALLKRREDLLQPLAAALSEAAQKIVACPSCGNIDTISPCTICQDPRRDRSLIVVVEEIADLWALERAGVVNAVYHVLGGHLSPLDGIGPEELNVCGSSSGRPRRSKRCCSPSTPPWKASRRRTISPNSCKVMAWR